MDNPGNCHSLIESMYFILMALTHETPSVSIPAASHSLLGTSSLRHPRRSWAPRRPRQSSAFKSPRSRMGSTMASSISMVVYLCPSNVMFRNPRQSWAFGFGGVNFVGGVPLPTKLHVLRPATELAGPSGRPVPKNLKMNFGGVGVLPPGAGMELGGAWSRKVGLVGGSMASTRSNFID